MQCTQWSWMRRGTGALVAIGVIGAGASVAKAQDRKDRQDEPGKPSADREPASRPPATMPPKTEETRPGPLDIIVQFRVDSAEIDAGASASLDQTAEWLKDDPARSVTIEIHPGDASADVNTALIAERAEATRRHLIGQGAAAGQIRIAIDGKGQEQVTPADGHHRAVFMVAAPGQGIDGSAVAEAPPAPEVFDVPDPVLAESTGPVIADEDPSDDHLLTPFGMAFTVGGGLVGFLDGEAREVGSLGGAWEARLTVGTRSPLAFEAAYVGSAQGMDALGLDQGAVLLGTAVEGDLRVNFTTAFVQPYLFGGIGFTRYDVVNEDFNTSSVNDSERMGHIPLGGGLGFQWGGFLFDVRGTVRAAFSDDLLDEPANEDDPLDESDTSTDLDTWSVAGRMGWEF
jgi:outer membrane protein OmpA-like peptidoglycan-associated protein